MSVINLTPNPDILMFDHTFFAVIWKLINLVI